MTETRKYFAAEQKIAILGRRLLDQVAISDLCDEYGIQPSVFYRWQQQLFENGAAAFGPPAKGATDALQQKIATLGTVLHLTLNHYRGILSSGRFRDRVP